MLPLVEAIRYFSTLQGSLMHQAVVILLLLLAGSLAIFGWRRDPAAGGVWLLAAVGVALAAQLALFSTGMLALMSATVPAFVLPPFDRAVSFISAVAFIWAGALPRNSRGGRIVPALFIVGAVVALVLSWLAWAQQSGGAVSYNKSLQETAWEAGKILLLAAGIIVLIARRAAGWWAGVFMLAVLLAGQLLHFRFPPAEQDYPGLERLADFAALPLFCLLAYIRTRAPLSAPVKVDTIAMETLAEPEVVAAQALPEAPVAAGEATLQAPAVREVEAVNEGEVLLASVDDAQVEALRLAQTQNARLSDEVAELRETLERTRRRAEALAEQEHSRLEEAASLRLDLEAARRKLDAAAEMEVQLAETRQEAEEQRQRADGFAAELGTAGAKLADLEGELEAMRPQLEMLDRLWVDLQVVQKQAEDRAKASPEPQPELVAQLDALQKQESLLRRELEAAHTELKRVGERLQQQGTELATARQEARAAQDEAAQMRAKLDKARAKGDRLTEQLNDGQAQIERYLDEVETLAALNHQQADDLDRFQAELEEAQRHAGDRAEESGRHLGEFGSISQTVAQAAAELEQSRNELEQARAQAAAEAAERARLEAELQAARTEAAQLAALRAELEAARRVDAELKHDVEMAQAEIARLNAQNKAYQLQIELSDRTVSEARAELAATQARLSGQPTRPQEEAANGEVTVIAPAKADKSKANGPDTYVHSGNGGDGHKARPAAPADVTLPAMPKVAPEPPRPSAPEAPPRGEPEPAANTDVWLQGSGVNACPRLGTLTDEDTRFTFSSPQHCCYGLDSPAEIDAEHQIAFCLTGAHTKCPIFAGQETDPDVPINTQAQSGDRRKRGRRLGGLLGGRK